MTNNLFLKMNHLLLNTKEVLLKMALIIKPALVTIALFFQPIQFVLLAVGGFILLDTALARVRVSLNKKRNKIKVAKGETLSAEDIDKAAWTSRKLRMGLVPKMLVYQSIVVVLFFLDYAILNQMVNMVFHFDYLMTKAAAFVLCYIEILSIDETFEKISGKSFFQYFLDLIKHSKKARKTLEGLNPGKKD
jgi:hypothetical protein